MRNPTAPLRHALLGALCLLPAFAFGQTRPAPRSVSADLTAATTPRSTVYKACVGAGRVGEGLRAEWQQQLKLCHDQLGFAQLRMHGLLHDELGVYTESKDGTPRYNFQYIDTVYDAMLAMGVKPFVEIGFMPNALASGTKTVFQWEANVTPPKDYAKWDALIDALVRHWVVRYGAAEVRTWNFEIWNEPNHAAFFEPKTAKTRMTEYFELYEHTARTVRGVDSSLKVGGPATAGPAYVAQLIDFCTTRDVPIDFISFHAYGLKGGPGGFDAEGNKLLYLNPKPTAVAGTANSQLSVIAGSAKPALPIHVTEWSTSYSSRDPVHDHYLSAPYILEQLRHTERLASMSYWTFTDIFEETGIPPRPFHGGFGLLNVQGIKKPAYFAYQFLNALDDRESKTDDGRAYVTTDAAGNIGCLFWDLDTAVPADASNQKIFGESVAPRATQDVAVDLKGCKPGHYRLAVYRVGFEKNDAYTRYLQIGAPTDLTPPQVAELKKAASGDAESETDVVINADGRFSRSFPVRTNDVYLVKLTRRGT